MRLLVFGGSFNPVHVGHLAMADEVRIEFGYDVVVLVPTYRPPHKELVSDPGPEARLAMLRLASEGDPSMVVDDCELLRRGFSYTIDTIRGISTRYAFDGKPGLLIGDDLAAGFASWREPQALALETDIIVARRLRERPSPLAFTHREAGNSLLPISSSRLRERIASGGACRYFLHPAVHAYIMERGLYGLR